MKFNVGDKVVVVKVEEQFKECLGKSGTIIDIDPEWAYPYEISFDNAGLRERQEMGDFQDLYAEDEIELESVINAERKKVNTAMNKFGVRDVFEFRIYDMKNPDEPLFIIDTASESVLRSRDMTVKDALVNVELLNDMMKGKYNLRPLRIVGKTTFRDLEMKDFDTTLNILNAHLKEFEFPVGGNNPSVVTLEFVFDGRNAKLEVE